MATNIKKKKVSELPEATDTSGFWIFGSKTIGGAVTSVKFAFDKITSLFGVSQEMGDDITLAMSQDITTRELRERVTVVKNGDTITKDGHYLMLSQGAITIGGSGSIITPLTRSDVNKAGYLTASGGVGEDGSSTLYKYTSSLQAIPQGATEVTVLSMGGAACPIQLFNASGAFISAHGNNVGNFTTPVNVTIPSNATKYRYSYALVSDNFKLEFKIGSGGVPSGQTIENKNAASLIKVVGGVATKTELNSFGEFLKLLKSGEVLETDGQYIFAESGEVIVNGGDTLTIPESVLTIDNTYLNSSGGTSSNASYKTSDYITIEAGKYKKIRLIGMAASSGSRSVAFYTSSNTVISVPSNTNPAFGQVQIIDIPATAVKIRLTSHKTYGFSCILLAADAIIINEDEFILLEKDGQAINKKSLFKIPNLFFADENTNPQTKDKYFAKRGSYPKFGKKGDTVDINYLTVTGYYVARSNGTLNSNPTYRCTELLPIEDIINFEFTPIASSTACAIAFYNGSVFITAEAQDAGAMSPPANATHYRLCARVDYDYTALIIKESSTMTPLIIASLSLLEFDGVWKAIPVGEDNPDNNKIRKDKTIALLSDFSLSSGTKTEDGISISASNLNNMRQLLFDVDTYIERIGMSVSFISTSSTKVNVWAGKGEMGIKVDAVNSKIYIQRLNGSLNGTEVHETIDLDFEILQNEKYTIGFQKVDEQDVRLFLYGSNGYFEKTYNKYASTNERRVAIAWGKPFFGVNNGNILVTEADIHSDYDLDSELIIAGDSFIEGTSLVGNGDSLEDRWCALTAADIGKMRTVISGKGGEQINTAFITRFKRELSWFGNLKYAIISLGTNNGSFSAYKTAMETLISYLKEKGITPILVTVTPRPGFDYNSVTKAMNDWVRSSGELYIDMNKAVTLLSDGSVWKPGFPMSDNVHPTVLGHKYMDNRRKIDIPLLANIKN